jgi:hypothetical protein
MCGACLESRIKSVREDWDHRYKAIKYFMLALGSSQAFINKNKGSVSIKCYPIRRYTQEEFREMLKPFLLKIGVDSWMFESSTHSWRIII